jgi:hypothetical protein
MDVEFKAGNEGDIASSRGDVCRATLEPKLDWALESRPLDAR